jgi:hypothetical protein
MSRSYWLGVMLFALVISLGAGYFTWSSLQSKKVVEVPLTKVSSLPVQQEPQAIDPTQEAETEIIGQKNEPQLEQPLEQSPELQTEVASKDVTDDIRNILFTYRHAAAKEVFVIGSFNNWLRQPMGKNDKGLWELAVQIKPGFYEYKFVVDNKRIRDPNNRHYTPGGNSILKVKPRSEE